MQEEETVNTNHCSVRIWQGQGLGFDAHHHLFHTKEKSLATNRRPCFSTAVNCSQCVPPTVLPQEHIINRCKTPTAILSYQMQTFITVPLFFFFQIFFELYSIHFPIETERKPGLVMYKTYMRTDLMFSTHPSPGEAKTKQHTKKPYRNHVKQLSTQNTTGKKKVSKTESMSVASH